jgi:CyaY protein
MATDLTEEQFEQRADLELHALEKAIADLGLELEIELQMGILSIEPPNGTTYIINSHRAAKQIWMAAERTAWHFDPMPDGRWVATKTGDELWSALGRVLGDKVGRPIALQKA